MPDLYLGKIVSNIDCDGLAPTLAIASNQTATTAVRTPAPLPLYRREGRDRATSASAPGRSGGEVSWPRSASP